MTNNLPSTYRSLDFGSRSYLAIAVFIVGALLALPLFIGSAFSSKKHIDRNVFDQEAIYSMPAPSREAFKAPNFNFLLQPPQGSPSTVDTFAGDCSTPKSVYNLQDTDLTVCAKFTNATPGWTVIWSNANFVAVQTTPITSATGSSTFTLSPTSSLGDWRVILFEPFGGTVQAVTRFTVVDAANPSADVSVSKGLISNGASSGHQVLFSIEVSNFGPSDAAAVQLSDDVPANTTFVSLGQLSGPTFTCNSPNTGDTGTSTCSITSLARGDSAVFIATYLVDTVANGTVISNTLSATSSTPDPNTGNNSSTSTVEIVTTPCQLSTPANITVSADPGQAGAVVSYAAPTGTGDCGQTGTGENGETIPAISCNPASGSFFPVGTTMVICAAQTGQAVTFQVTVDNPGALSISLNDSDSLTIECGQRFADPGATAIDGSGQSIPVMVSYTGGFNPDSPAVGTYTGTYTATDGPNSVSTNRTIIVEDNEAPAITIAGANPYKIQQGSCSPFVDPGASAFDNCSGAKAVTSSISGPGGATSVNPAIAGTYIVTYTATDGTHEATATRTVLVGDFPADEVDQPGTSNVPPTILLNGDAQITVECGTSFTDPGATATVCGSSVTVTTSGSVNANSPGTYSITYSATANGFTSETTRIVTVEDTVAPVITLNGDNPMTVGFATVFTDPGATASDGCAGDLTAAISVSGSVNTNIVGAYTLTYTVSDPSGHTDTKVRTVNVSPYNFSGFFAPIDNLPTVNQMKAGQAAPLKFSLGGNQGLNIFAAGSPNSIQISCDSSAPLNNLEQTETAGNSSLSYDSTTDQYKYVWKTESSWKNTCRQLTVTLKDNTQHSAIFKFK